ncbi:TRAP transporter TAXI family solute receptor [Caldalkalibacillus uzonensis]|uniref:TRAP transporter TAXI family solute receptor n=1 Tax=Caldalkalibacillus uzonensis TaxID=353224 RepID=A0ABU0CXZ0_9BACI|nr:TAXI family TRAP transporter solute-binding subunit [Caldalkalibacillus uzonensis]MDQ0341017.1 TRAP transporter TAXI family solute receptor [Caldalkalibacillus uzonensis]
MIGRKFPLILLLTFVALVACSQETVQTSNGSEANGDETLSSTGSESISLNMATLSQGSSWYVYGATMASILQDEVDEINRVDVLPYSGGYGNVDLLDNGEADIALTFNLNNLWAYNGDNGYEQKYENIRALVGGMDKYYVGIVMTNEFVDRYDITSIADIKEKEIPIRLLTVNRGSQGEMAARQILEVYGLDYDTIKSYGGSVEHTSFDVVQSSIQDGRGDMFIQVMTEGHPAFTEIAIQTPVTFISVEDEYLEKLREYGYVKNILPPNVYNGQDYEVQSPGLSTTLTTTTELSEDLAYAITKALAENKERLVDGHNALSYYIPEEGLHPDNIGRIPLHPGAEKYYQEKGWLE